MDAWWWLAYGTAGLAVLCAVAAVYCACVVSAWCSEREEASRPE